MKTIGVIGGMSWESTVSYYQVINRTVALRLGGWHSARLAMMSVDFHEIEVCQRDNRWDDAAAMLAEAAQALERAGAGLIVLATNTMHKVAPAIESAVTVPFLHIADATAAAVRSAGLTRVGLLGTRFTMEESFYRGRLETQHGLQVVVPPSEDRDLVHRVIYDELCLGRVDAVSREQYKAVVAGLVNQGAEGVILGCTEIGLLLRPEDVTVPLFDTARLHAEAAVQWALGD